MIARMEVFVVPGVVEDAADVRVEGIAGGDAADGFDVHDVRVAGHQLDAVPGRDLPVERVEARIGVGIALSERVDLDCGAAERFQISEVRIGLEARCPNVDRRPERFFDGDGVIADVEVMTAGFDVVDAVGLRIR